MKVSKISKGKRSLGGAIFYLRDLSVGTREVLIYFKRTGLNDEFLSLNGWQEEEYRWIGLLTECGSNQYCFSIDRSLVQQFSTQSYMLGLSHDDAYEEIFFWDELRDEADISTELMVIHGLRPERRTPMDLEELGLGLNFGFDLDNASEKETIEAASKKEEQSEVVSLESLVQSEVKVKKPVENEKPLAGQKKPLVEQKKGLLKQEKHSKEQERVPRACSH